MSLRGITVSQLDEPFSQARSTALCVLSGNLAFTSSSSSLNPSSFSFWVAYTSHCTSVSSGVSWDCASISLTSGALTLIEAEYPASTLSDGFMSPRPPIRTGNATRSIGRTSPLPLSSGIRRLAKIGSMVSGSTNSVHSLLVSVAMDSHRLILDLLKDLLAKILLKPLVSTPKGPPDPLCGVV